MASCAGPANGATGPVVALVQQDSAAEPASATAVVSSSHLTQQDACVSAENTTNMSVRSYCNNDNSSSSAKVSANEIYHNSQNQQSQQDQHQRQHSPVAVVLSAGTGSIATHAAMVEGHMYSPNSSVVITGAGGNASRGVYHHHHQQPQQQSSQLLLPYQSQMLNAGACVMAPLSPPPPPTVTTLIASGPSTVTAVGPPVLLSRIAPSIGTAGPASAPPSLGPPTLVGHGRLMTINGGAGSHSGHLVYTNSASSYSAASVAATPVAAVSSGGRYTLGTVVEADRGGEVGRRILVETLTDKKSHDSNTDGFSAERGGSCSRDADEILATDGAEYVDDIEFHDATSDAGAHQPRAVAGHLVEGTSTAVYVSSSAAEPGGGGDEENVLIEDDERRSPIDMKPHVTSGRSVSTCLPTVAGPHGNAPPIVPRPPGSGGTTGRPLILRVVKEVSDHAHSLSTTNKGDTSSSNVKQEMVLKPLAPEFETILDYEASNDIVTDEEAAKEATRISQELLSGLVVYYVRPGNSSINNGSAGTSSGTGKPLPGRIKESDVVIGGEGLEIVDTARVNEPIGAQTSYDADAGDEKRAKYVCHLCKLHFTAGVEHRYHMRSFHNATAARPCPICTKPFYNTTDLRNHVMAHKGVKPYKCQVCGHAFTVKSNLTNHMLRHGQLEYQCEICGKRLAQPASLKKHLKSHAGEKPYKCSFCDKRFLQRGDLTRHQLVHNGQRDFPCDLCERQFSLKANLQTHRRKVHGQDTMVNAS